ncbi:hypothetical protein COCNU_contig69520781G000010 [Cocos nucifera]|nr:hypothetical protein [Cocos nucifera]
MANNINQYDLNTKKIPKHRIQGIKWIQILGVLYADLRVTIMSLAKVRRHPSKSQTKQRAFTQCSMKKKKP